MKHEQDRKRKQGRNNYNQGVYQDSIKIQTTGRRGKELVKQTGSNTGHLEEKKRQRGWGYHGGNKI